jgi:NitT/TauT family transport system ATP-binding protein
MDNHNLIQIQSVSKHYGPAHESGMGLPWRRRASPALEGTAPDGRPLLALREVSLNVRAHEFLSLIGPSGCGKSTLLRLVGDLLMPNQGRIQIDGRTPEESRHARQVAIVFQSPTLMEWRSIQDNIELPLEILGVPAAERARRATELLDLIRMRDFSTRYPYELSAGMQQQVSIARALAYRPSILLMDEPFGALDELTRERLGQELLEIWERTQVTILFVTHSVDEAVLLSDRVAVLTPRPGHVERVVDIDLPRPRQLQLRESPRYLELMRTVRAGLHLNGERRGPSQ